MGWLQDTFGRLGRGKQTGMATGTPSAAARSPADAAWREHGNAALAAGDLVQAARCYAEGANASPADPTPRLNHGFVLLELGQPGAAEVRLREALTLCQPGDDVVPDAHFLLGRARALLGRTDEALLHFSEAARFRAGFAEPLEEAVGILDGLRRHAEAVEWARRLVAVRSAPASQLVLATQWVRAGRPEQALPILDRLCLSEPANIDASRCRFEALFDARQWSAALDEAHRTAALTGAHPGAFANIAAALEKLGRLEEALAFLDRALLAEPGHLGAIVSRVALLTQSLRLEEAAAAAEDALAVHPDDPDLHWNLALVRLLRGEFQTGWREHEWRLRVPGLQHKVRRVDAPMWHGERLAGRTILLHGEQGFGDNIQFVRLLPRVAAGAGQVLLQLDAALQPLLRGNVPANVKLLANDEACPAVDCHAPLMSLPAILDLAEHDFAPQIPYLRAQPAAVQRWQARLPREGLKVGIAWSGNPQHANDHNRSLPLAAFRSVATDGCRFVTVQPQRRDADRVLLASWAEAEDLGRELGDFADTAALIAALDLVVTVDTSVAHLAGALGKPVWILLPHAPDWRWLLARTDSPWYPTARLYRQPRTGDWGSVLPQVRADLQRLLQAR